MEKGTPVSRLFKYFRGRDMAIAMSLTVVTLVLYLPVQNHDFVEYDDQAYIFEQPLIRSGFSLTSAKWAMIASVAANWHPLTLFSHMLDCEIFGLNPAGHHISSLLFHMVNVLLLYAFLRIATKHIFPAFFATLLFALHPLNVDSVAWIAQRKTLLSGFFSFLALLSYVNYTRNPTTKRYLPVVLFFTFAIMSKPIAITLPFLLLLIDYWPLQRIHAHATTWRHDLSDCASEKIPLIILSLTGCFTTLITQGRGAIVPLHELPIHARFMQAPLNYVHYLVKTFWPIRLSVYYPPLAEVPLSATAGAIIFIICLTVLSLVFIRRFPFVFVGWFWFLIAMIPTIGIVAIGRARVADRYAYLPLIGLFIIVAWTTQNLARSYPRLKYPIFGVVGALCIALFAISKQQLAHWKDSISLFQRAVAVTDANYLMMDNLARALAAEGRVDEGIHYMESVIRENPNNADYLETAAFGRSLSRSG